MNNNYFLFKVIMNINKPYRVSTITATGSINKNYSSKNNEPFIDLDTFYNFIKIEEDENKEGVSFIEYGKNKFNESEYKGFSSKLSITKRNSEPKTKRFDNQVTLVYRKIEDNLKNEINVKLFKNGMVQMTGIRYIQQGEILMNKLVDIIKIGINNNIKLITDVNILECCDYKIQLINSDFDIGFKIKREWFFKEFTTYYQNHCTYEPCIYPGVKIIYYFNNNNFYMNGLCYCKDYDCCNLKNSAKKLLVQDNKNICRKITIAVFQSGKLIITGAQNYEQIDEAYNFISKILLKHEENIKMISQQINDDIDKKEKIYILINKKNIIYN